MTKKIHEDLLITLAPFCGWDPDHKLNKYDKDEPESLNPPVDIPQEEMKEAITQYFDGTTLGEEMVKASEYKTLKEVIDHMPNINVMLWADGKISDSDLVDLVKLGLTPIDRYRYPFETGKEFIEACGETTRKLWQMREEGVGMVDLTGVVLKVPSKGKRAAIDKLLESAELPDIASMITLSKSNINELQAAQKAEGQAKAEAERLEQDLKHTQDALRDAQFNAGAKMDLTYEADGEIPEGKMVSRKASDIWPDIEGLDFEVPFFEWDGDHPQVPAIDTGYIFRPDMLKSVLYAFVSNKRGYLQGHTGSGKTTLLEQVAAHLNFPFIRINFDSEITRMDLIGRDTLVDGKSEFIDGMLPRAMSQPCICAFDEIDFVRPDVAYVMQAALEGNGLRITEDGDRLVKPHPMFRMFATGNTVGQGDEDGMYQGARPQSMAFLDRFTVWVNVPYMDEMERAQLLRAKCPSLTSTQSEAILQFVTEHMAAFKEGEVGKPMTPRGMLSIGEATTFLGDVRKAIKQTVTDGCIGSDKAILEGLADRV